MAYSNGREALRGVEVMVFHGMFAVLTPEKCAEWLTVPLQRAVAKGNSRLAQQLGRAGAEVGDGDALHETIQAGNEVDATAKNNSRREALRGEEVLIFDLMFEVPYYKQWAEWLEAPLERAAAKGERVVAQKLVRARANTRNALHKAVLGGHREVASDLLESGASVAAKNAIGRTPLHVAACHGKTEMVQLLLLKGADMACLITTDVHRFISLFYGHVAAALALLAAGADVSLPRPNLKTQALHGAVISGRVELVRAVIKHGADMNAGARDKQTPLHLAAGFDKVKVIPLLVEAGANIESRDVDGATPLHYTADRLCRASLLSLLKQGASVNAQTDSLGTPLMGAAVIAGTKGGAEVVDALLRAGADETIVDIDGNKAADVVGEEFEGEDRLAADVERVRELLANAPADRAWRRRGYLVLCRAYPDRLDQNQVTSGSTHLANTALETRSLATLGRAKASSCHETVGGGNVDESTGGDWAVVVPEVLLLPEKGIFQTIMGYL